MGDSRGKPETPQISNSVTDSYVQGSVIQFRDQYAVDATELAQQFVAAHRAAQEEAERQEREAALEAEMQAREAEKLQAARQAALLREKEAREAEKRRAEAAREAQRKRAEAAREAQSKQAEAKQKDKDAPLSCALAIVGLLTIIAFCRATGFPWGIAVIAYVGVLVWYFDSSE